MTLDWSGHSNQVADRPAQTSLQTGPETRGEMGAQMGIL